MLFDMLFLFIFIYLFIILFSPFSYKTHFLQNEICFILSEDDGCGLLFPIPTSCHRPLTRFLWSVVLSLWWCSFCLNTAMHLLSVVMHHMRFITQFAVGWTSQCMGPNLAVRDSWPLGYAVWPVAPHKESTPAPAQSTTDNCSTISTCVCDTPKCVSGKNAVIKDTRSGDWSEVAIMNGAGRLSVALGELERGTRESERGNVTAPTCRPWKHCAQRQIWI